MPSNHYSAFDRGFDLGHVDVPPTQSPVLSRRLASRPSRKSPLRMIAAVAAVATMILTALAVVAPALQPGLTELPIRVDAGEQEITYELSHFGESYMKTTNYAYQGNRTLTEGLNPWWGARQTNYGEYIVRTVYPFITSYELESGFTTPDTDPGFGLQTMARMHIAAKNLTSMGTADSKDPIFIPILDDTTPGGGNVTLQWRSDVMTPQEVADMKAVVSSHFARTYYGAPRYASLADDGYFNELYGHMTFDRAAAMTYLDLPGVGDLRAEFNTSNAGNAIGDLWLNDWGAETGGQGIYDIAAAYEYSNDIKQLRLTLDPSSTANLIKVRIWSLSWGNDALMMRYFDVSGLNRYMQSYFEDMYFNATIGVNSADIDTSYYMQYAILGWADQTTGKAAWMLEPMHLDYVGSSDPLPAWQSRFNPYDPEQTDATRLSLLPGTTMYGQQVSYYTAPSHWNLNSGEKLTVKLPTRNAVGYAPYVGASDVLSVAKVAEINTHAYWGEWVLGNCVPGLSSYYNPVTKTITVNGPTAFSQNANPSYPALNYTGVPQFVFDVSKVSSYDVKVLPVGGPYFASVAYTVNVTAKNLNGTATAWDGSLTLTSNIGGAVFGSTTHTFTNNAYWQTTVTFPSPVPAAYVNATDTWFAADVGGSQGPFEVHAIPQFGLLVVPLVGAVAVFAVLRRRKTE